MTEALRPAHTDWLHHHLDVQGEEAVLAAFAERACGAGTIPWCLDLDRIEEDAFHRLAVAGALSLDGAGILAGQLRAAVGRRHRVAMGRVGRSRACPFDLHSVLPVPGDVLALGPDHPDAVDWLWANWGTTDALRRVTRRASCRATLLSLGFWSADWTPWRAIEAVRADWPGLGFDVRPQYGRE